MKIKRLRDDLRAPRQGHSLYETRRTNRSVLSELQRDLMEQVVRKGID